MAIYRGPGGAGDAVNDAASEVLLALAAKDAAVAAQVAAEAARTAAEAAQAAAELAETNAETAETNAETAETNAETAEANAETAQAAAEAAQAAAETAETNAAASASAASTSAGNASTSASNAATSATNAANSASTATTQATNASNSASSASTSATNAANSATAAANSATAAANSATAAQTAETNAETAETNAAASASAASTSATNASNSASSASTSATNASNSASSASTSASNAASSASSASTSASNAATSATAAQNAQTAAETARDQTLTAYDNFDDRYLGAKTSNPTLDNDGNALIAGALYFNSVDGAMRVYTGSVWVDAYAAGTSFLAKANNLSDLTNVATARQNLDLEIGVDVQAYDADTAKYDDATANFIGTLQNGGSNVVVDSDIGSTVQAYDADTVKYDDANPSFTATSAIKIPAGTTGERPAGVAGKLRFNSTTNEFEGYNGTAWASFGNATGQKNYLDNGNFDIWQTGRTASTTTGANILPDRWQYINDGTNGSAVTFSRETFTTGQTDVPNNPTYFLNWAFTSITTPSNYIRQRIENVRTLAGQQITISAWVKVASGTHSMGFAYQQEFGTGGSPSAGVYPAGVNFTATTTWTRYTATFNVASISGKTIGTNGDDAINIAIYAAGGNQTISVAQVQCELGPVATSYDVKSIQTELARCQRYYLAIGSGGSFGSSVTTWTGQADAGGNAQSSISFGQYPVTMRAAPSIAFSGVNFYSAATGVTTFTLNTNRSSTTSGACWVNVNGLTAGQGTVLFIPTSGYIAFGAEL